MSCVKWDVKPYYTIYKNSMAIKASIKQMCLPSTDTGLTELEGSSKSTSNNIFVVTITVNGIRILADYFVLSQCMRLTDRRTERQMLTARLCASICNRTAAYSKKNANITATYCDQNIVISQKVCPLSL